jgi:hypothetical protein
MVAEALIDQLETLADAVIDARVESMPLGVVRGCLEGGLQAI